MIAQDELKTNEQTVRKQKTKALVCQTLDAEIVRCPKATVDNTLVIDYVASCVMTSNPIEIDITDSPLDLELSLTTNMSAYFEASNTVMLQAQVFLGFPPGVTGPFLVGKIPSHYAPQAEQSYYVNIPLYNLFPPLPFSCQGAVAVRPDGSIHFNFMSGVLGYMYIPIQLKYKPGWLLV